MMAKTRPIRMLVLVAALLLQGFADARAAEPECCPGDCRSGPAICLMITTGGSCGACQAAVSGSSALNASASDGSGIFAFDTSANGYVSTRINSIWRPPIAA